MPLLIIRQFVINKRLAMEAAVLTVVEYILVSRCFQAFYNFFACEKTYAIIFVLVEMVRSVFEDPLRLSEPSKSLGKLFCSTPRSLAINRNDRHHYMAYH